VIDIQICGSETPKQGSNLHYGLAEAKESNSYELLKQTVTFSKIELHIFQIFQRFSENNFLSVFSFLAWAKAKQ